MSIKKWALRLWMPVLAVSMVVATPGAVVFRTQPRQQLLPAQPRFRLTRSRLLHGPRPGESLGRFLSRHESVVGLRQRHRTVHALQRSRHEAGPGRNHSRRPAQRHPPARSSIPTPELRRLAFHLLDRGWNHRVVVGRNQCCSQLHLASRRGLQGTCSCHQWLRRHYLYATDFHNNAIDVFDKNFNLVSTRRRQFTDPSLPTGYAPFNIQAVGNRLYVTYAVQDAAKHDDVAGPGIRHPRRLRHQWQLRSAPGFQWRRA